MHRLKDIAIILLLLVGVNAYGQKNENSSRIKFVENVVVVKLLPSHSAFFMQEKQWVGKKAFKGVESVSQMFEGKIPNSFKRSSANQVDLSLIYSLQVANENDENQVIESLQNLDIFEYVERKKINFVAFIPNDPSVGSQNYLSQVSAYSAWDITTGNAQFKIGIVDTGTDMDHPDLQSEMAQNTADPVNGLDDDNDGYIDNFTGWDFMDNDNNPQIGQNAHGIHVAGIAAAATNNGEGVASSGYNTQYVPVRVGNGTEIIYGYEGIVYAADLGCDIINCSWGGFGYSALEEDVINYATFNKNALVVCAAGNQNRDQKYYPAAYENSLAVSSVNGSDQKSSFTNQGYWIDIAAPGENVYSTVDNGLYNSNTGTSMASPVVAGAAALVKARYPQLSSLQIAERLKTKSTDINSLNPGFENKIGVGRLNIGEAVTGNITEASVVFGNVVITNKTDDVFKGTDSLFISGTFTNYLSASGNVVATISSNSSYVQVNRNTENVGALGSLVQVDNYSTPFSFKLLDTAPINTYVTFKIVVTDGVFNNEYYLKVLINVDYLNITTNNISTTVGSKGQFGYNTRNQLQGLGVAYKTGTSQLFEGGLMIGTNQNGFTRVVDRVRNGNSSWDNDFTSIENIKEIVPSPKGDYYIEGIFDDSNAMADTLGLMVKYDAYASSDFGHENYVIFEYEIINTNAVEVTNVHAGLFADFDVADFAKNTCLTDINRFMTYTESTEFNKPVFGVQLLTSQGFKSYCLDNVNGGLGGVDIFNGFTNAKKYTTLTSNRYHSGPQDITGNDVVQVTSGGGFAIQPNDTVKIAFAILAAENVGILTQVADSSYKRYNGKLPNSVRELNVSDSKLKVYPNPATDKITIDVANFLFHDNWSIKITNVLGKEVFFQNEIGGTQLSLFMNGFSAGVYFVEIQIKSQKITTKFIKNR
tara:strand:- start:64678 stop:67467 length:2790 start_codon:yes stop_codon:yes gene_type:complete